MPKNLTAARLRKLLTAAPKEQLVEDMLQLFTKFDVVRKHFELQFQPQDESKILDGYKTRVERAMLPKSDFGEPKVQQARKLIAEYRKIALSSASVADLMLVYVESGVEFLLGLGDYKISFYDSLERMFESALKHIKKHQLELEFADRCRVIVKQSHNLGYGIGDTIAGMMSEYIEFD